MLKQKEPSCGNSLGRLGSNGRQISIWERERELLGEGKCVLWDGDARMRRRIMSVAKEGNTGS